jgi:hypothetical protein
VITKKLLFLVGGLGQFRRETSGLGEMIEQTRMIEASHGDAPDDGRTPAIEGKRAAAHPADRMAPTMEI